jgi:hypothetical protein
MPAAVGCDEAGDARPRCRGGTLAQVTEEQPVDELRYDCERCGRGFVEPRAGRHLGVKGNLEVLWNGLGRTLRHQEDLASSLGAARRKLALRADDEAFRHFAQSVRFCQSCRQFVCHECWSSAGGVCRLCAGREASRTAAPEQPVPAMGLGGVRPVVSVLPDAPRRVRGYVSRVVLAGVLLLLVFGTGLAVAVAASQIGKQSVAAATGTPGVGSNAAELPAGADASSLWVPRAADPSPQAKSAASSTPRVSPTAMPRRTSMPAPAATPSHRSAAGPTATPSPTASPTATPTVTPLDKPAIACTATPNDGITAPYTLDCRITSGTYEAGDAMHWFLDGADYGDGNGQVSDLEVHHVQLEVTRTGTDPACSDTISGASGSW